jgi:YegS/Rv2252/BmrU family lipid kinase
VQATLILNMRSSRTAHHVGDLREQLAARGVEIDTFEVIDDNAQVERRVKRAAKRGASLIIVGGGDGTMTLAVNALAHRDAALGVIPLGTGNSFARTLGIGDDIGAALDVIAAGRIARVDLGIVNKRYFANFATIGLSAEIAESTSHDLKGVIGAAAYAVAGIKPFLTHRPFRAKIRWDDGDMRITAQQMVIASGRFFGHQPVTPAASITSGKLAFFTTTGVSHVDIARMYIAFGLGLQMRLPDAQTFSAKRIVIRTKAKQPINVDGNPAGLTPARFSVAHRALRVLVPAEFADANS